MVEFVGEFKRGSREVPERKQRTDDDSWMHDEDINDDIRQLAGTQGDRKYYSSEVEDVSNNPKF